MYRDINVVQLLQSVYFGVAVKDLSARRLARVRELPGLLGIVPDTAVGISVGRGGTVSVGQDPFPSSNPCAGTTSSSASPEPSPSSSPSSPPTGPFMPVASPLAPAFTRRPFVVAATTIPRAAVSPSPATTDALGPRRLRGPSEWQRCCGPACVNGCTLSTCWTWGPLPGCRVCPLLPSPCSLSLRRLRCQGLASDGYGTIVAPYRCLFHVS
jgi:hypothetical protein